MADTISDTDVFVHTTGVESSEVPDGYVIYEPKGKQVHYLNPTAVLVYEFCDGRRDVGSIARSLTRAYELSDPPLEDVKKCLASLLGQKLIQRQGAS